MTENLSSQLDTKKLANLTYLWILFLFIRCIPHPVVKKQPSIPSFEAKLKIPKKITKRNFAELVYIFRTLSDKSPLYQRLRQSLIQYQIKKAERGIKQKKPSKVIKVFKLILSLYSSKEIEKGRITSKLLPLSDYIISYFSSQGDEAKVMSALLVKYLITKKRVIIQEYEKIANWARQARYSTQDPLNQINGLISIYEEIGSFLPIAKIVHYLEKLYLNRYQILASLLKREEDLAWRILIEPEYKLYQLDLLSTPYFITRIYLMADNPLGAFKALDSLKAKLEPARAILSILKGIKKKEKEAYLSLAQIFTHQDPKVGIQVCLKAQKLFPKESMFPRCAGLLYYKTKQFKKGLLSYKRAILLSPHQRRLYEEMLELLNATFIRRIEKEDIKGAYFTLKKIERTVRKIKAKWPKKRKEVRLEQLYREMGLLYFNTGKIRKSREMLKHSLKIKLTHEVLLRLALIAERRAEFKSAIKLYYQALRIKIKDTYERLYWRALSLKGMGNVFAAKGDMIKAKKLWLKALDTWDRVLPFLSSEGKAVAYLNKGLIFSRIGRQKKALESFQDAIEVQPERRATYARLLAFCTSHNFFQKAIDIYHMARTHISLSEQWKIYYALWMLSLEWRHNDYTGTNARQFLKEVKGRKWHHLLASFYSGELSFKELLAQADTPGKRAEAYFYEAQKWLAKNRIKRVYYLLKKVIETDMMGFFEYEMALDILRQLENKR
jgi:tetratricopeptide (TPR) repeat protein